jgi:hypothetical protein
VRTIRGWSSTFSSGVGVRAWSLVFRLRGSRFRVECLMFLVSVFVCLRVWCLWFLFFSASDVSGFRFSWFRIGVKGKEV